MTTTTTYRQKDGGWQIIVSYKDGSGRWRQKSRQGFATKRDAKEAEAAIIKSIKKAPRPVDRSLEGITLMDFALLYLKVKKSIVEPTKKNYMNAVRSLQALANKPVHTITYLDLQNAVSGWTIAPQTQRQYKSKLNILFRAAVKPYGLIASNPMADIEIEKVRNVTERKTVTEAQFRRLMTVRDPDVRLGIAICYYTGLRRAELIALTWPDINNMTITVNKQLAYRIGRKAPKSKNGFRTIPIPQPLMAMLTEYRKSQPVDIERRLFTRPFRVGVLMGEELHKLDKNLSVHCLRHTYATTLLAKGVDVRTVAALLGDDVKTVIGTYIHYSDDMRKAAAENIDKIFAV